MRTLWGGLFGFVSTAVGAIGLARAGTSPHLLVGFIVIGSVASGFALLRATREWRKLRRQLDEQAQSQTRRVTKALASASVQLVLLRDEHKVIEMALKPLRAEGWTVSFLVVERHLLRDFGAADGFIGPLDDLTHATALFASGLPAPRFAETGSLPVERLRGIAAPASGAGVLKSIDVPIKVEQQRYALLCIDADELPEGVVHSIELFASNVAAAIENVRHHLRAELRLEELLRLHGELVARERMAIIGEASAVLAHEIRNPIAAIANVIALLRRGMIGGIGDQLNLLDAADEEIERLELLIQDLLVFSGPLNPRPRTVEIADLMKHAADTTRAAARTAGVEVTWLIPAEAGALDGDPNQLNLMMSNILRNALSAAPQGSMVGVQVLHNEALVEVVIEDEGPGVPPGLQEKIFDPFFTTRADGTGLGLAIVRRVVAAHGGRIRVSNRPEGGARFHVILPRFRRPQAPYLDLVTFRRDVAPTSEVSFSLPAPGDTHSWR